MSAASSVPSHPRRVAAENSVCLKRFVDQSPAAKSPPPLSVCNLSAASNVAANGEDLDAVARWMPDSFNADKWFDHSNQNASGKSNARFIDNDSPFYLRRNRSSEDSTKSNRSRSRRAPIGYAAPQMRSSGSSSEDFRSVIDDLTIENKELKQKLRRYEQLYSSHLQEDRLFEVRVHGLSPTKRRKLEKTLRDFAASVGASPETFSSDPLPRTTSIPPKYPSALQYPSSSQSNSKPIDSAYASLSASGGASVSRSQHNPESLGHVAQPPPKDQKVHRYLQDISQVLVPKISPIMTEEATKRLVVERLEQLFVGRVGSSHMHSQSQQQQEVSQSAASADRLEIEAMGNRVAAEGDREAKIYLDPYNIEGGITKHENSMHLQAESSPNPGLTGTAVTPDQRPTRPLDLDPARAQNPAENIEYMKHLGFDSPKMDVDTTLEEGEGWVYLNLLINMAQLHILNVTPDFVRNAISELSTKFEISKDRQSVRWKGGKSPTSMLSESGTGTSEGTDSPSNGFERVRSLSNSKSSKPSHEDLLSAADALHSRNRQDNDMKLVNGKSSAVRRSTEYQSYSPLFLYDDGGKYDSPRLDRWTSMSNQPTEENPGIRSRGSLSNVQRPFKSNTLEESGPIIFYHGAGFCTDLGGDFTPSPTSIVYERKSQGIMGDCKKHLEETKDSENVKGPISSSFPLLSKIDTGDDGDALIIDTSSASSATSEEEAAHPTFESIDLAASGIGGVIPGDNIRVEVRRQFYRAQSEYVSVVRRELAPADLPSPSYAFLHFTSSSSESDGSEEDEDSSCESRSYSIFVDNLNERNFVPTAYLSAFSTESTHRSPEDVSDDSSIDMLDFARKVDPETVAAREQEFERHTQSDRFDKAPESVAATVGNASPARGIWDDIVPPVKQNIDFSTTRISNVHM